MAGMSLASILSPKLGAPAPQESMPVYDPADYPTDQYTDRELLELMFHNANEARFMIHEVLKSASTNPFLSKMLPKVE